MNKFKSFLMVFIITVFFIGCSHKTNKTEELNYSIFIQNISSISEINKMCNAQISENLNSKIDRDFLNNYNKISLNEEDLKLLKLSSLGDCNITNLRFNNDQIEFRIRKNNSDNFIITNGILKLENDKFKVKSLIIGEK